MAAEPGMRSVGMDPKVGDRILLEAEKVGQSARSGVIEEVLALDRLRIRVRWDDGHSSVVAPTSGAVVVKSSQGSSD